MYIGCLYTNSILLYFDSDVTVRLTCKTKHETLENFHSLKSPILPSGLMVFSSDSLSFDFPLDMSAAMEKAVYSMMRVLKTILNCTNVQMKPRS